MVVQIFISFFFFNVHGLLLRSFLNNLCSDFLFSFFSLFILFLGPPTIARQGGVVQVSVMATDPYPDLREDYEPRQPSPRFWQPSLTLSDNGGAYKRKINNDVLLVMKWKETKTQQRRWTVVWRDKKENGKNPKNLQKNCKTMLFQFISPTSAIGCVA